MVTRLFVELSGSCAARCPSCALPLDSALTTARYQELFRSARRVGFDFVGAFGRQPLGQAASEEVLGTALDQGMDVRVYSTLFGGTGPEVAPSLAGRIDVTVLLWGSRATHDQATGVTGSFDEAIDAAARWRDSGSSVLVKVPASVSGLTELANVSEAVARVGLPLTPAAWWPVVYGEGKAPAPPSPTVLSSMFTESETFTGFSYSPDAHVCKAGRGRAYVDARFTLYPCFESLRPIADLDVEDFGSVWRDDVRWGPWRRSTLADLHDCAECEVKPGCHICPAPEFDGRGRACSGRQLAVAHATTVQLRRREHIPEGAP